MQREIEALFAAYLADRNKEAQVVRELLTALAAGSAGRQRMLQEFAAAVGATAVTADASAAPMLDRASPPQFNDEISAAIAQLRTSRAPATH